MRLPSILTFLLGAALLSGTVSAEPKETTMAKKTDKTATCTDETSPRKGNGGIARGPGANADGGSDNVGADTGNGGMAIGRGAQANGGDRNVGSPCKGKARLGNGGTVTGSGSANGGSGNVVKF